MLKVIDDEKLADLLNTLRDNDYLHCENCPCVDEDCRHSTCAEKVVNSFEVDVRRLSTAELKEAQNILSTIYERVSIELDNRRQQEKKEDWNKVVDTMKEFIAKYGEILIDPCTGSRDDILLSGDFDDSINGIIRLC